MCSLYFIGKYKLGKLSIYNKIYGDKNFSYFIHPLSYMVS